MRVDFYVLSDASVPARLLLACRLAEKAYLASQSVLIWHTERAELEMLDERLWTFTDTSFVPHDWLGGGAEAPVMLSVEPPAGPVQILIHLGLSMQPPPFLAHVARVIEIVDGEPSRRDAGRARFKAYRRMGLSPGTHTLQTP